MGPWVVVAALLVAQNSYPTFTARAELADSLGTALARASDPERHGQLALLYVRAMRSALGAIPMGAKGQEPYRTFLEHHESDAIYSEPSGEWMLRPESIWAIHAANRQSSSAEAIAWEAVENGMPGECEGYPPCELSTLDALDGEYLRRHPAGDHVTDAVRRLTQTFVELERLLSAPNGHDLFDRVNDCTDLTSKAEALKNAISSARAEGSDALTALMALRTRCP